MINSEIPYKEILLLILGTISTFLIWRLQHQKERIRSVESQLSDRKYKVYSELIYVLFDIAGGSKIGKEVSEKELLKRILDVKKDMFIYAPDEIFKTFTEWTLQLDRQDGTVDHFKIYFRLMKLIRKDMGHTKTKIDLDDFMLFLMQSDEEYRKFKKLNNW